MKVRTTLRQALCDPQLLGHVLAGPSWFAWRVLLIAAMGEPLIGDDEHAAFKRLTGGREHEPLQRVAEFEIVAGRRGGKTRALAALATYIATLCDHRDALAPGETGILLALAQDQRVAKKILDFVEDDLERSPILSQLTVGRNADSIELKHSIRVEVRPASFRKLRGPTYVAVICDELGFWFVEEGYANPDSEIIASVVPGLLTTRGPLILASSPYAKRGVLWDNFKKHYGPDGAPSVLVAKGTTRDLNPTVPQEEIDRLIAKDPARNSAEYLAEFRSDLQSFVSAEAVAACVASGVFERPRARGISYIGFVDPSGGCADSFTLAIGHMAYATETVVIDCLREMRPPFSPESVVAEFATLLKSYGVTTIIGDRYGGEWPREAFGKHGISYEQSAKPKSELYVDLLPLLNSARIELLDHPRLIAQLCSLERRTARSGRDSIDHPPGGHDDLANVVAGLAGISLGNGAYDGLYRGWNDADDDDDRERARAQRAQRLAIYMKQPPTLADWWWRREA